MVHIAERRGLYEQHVRHRMFDFGTEGPALIYPALTTAATCAARWRGG
jgi:hypothetical protein